MQVERRQSTKSERESWRSKQIEKNLRSAKIAAIMTYLALSVTIAVAVTAVLH